MSNKEFTTHNGVKIFLTPGGAFTADVNGKHESRPSVQALKKLIEKKAQFEPFSALREGGRYGQPGHIESFLIVGSKKNPRRSHMTEHLWIDDKGNTHAYVDVDTPENRLAMQAVIDKRAANKVIEQRLEMELRELHGKVVRRHLDAEIKRAAQADEIKAAGAEALEVGKVYKIDHSRKGKFVGKVLEINDDFVDVEIVDGTARMLSSWNEDGQPGDVLQVRTLLAKWELAPEVARA